MPCYCLTSCKKSKKSGTQFQSNLLKKSNFGPNLTFCPHPQGAKSFCRKSENVTFLHLRCSNFVQNIKNFWHADPEISALQTNGRTNGWTNEAEFIGPFRLKLWVQKCYKFYICNVCHVIML